MPAAFVRCARAASIAGTTTTASEVAGDVEAVIDARIDDSELIRRCSSHPCGSMEALEQLRRRMAAVAAQQHGGLDKVGQAADADARRTTRGAFFA